MAASSSFPYSANRVAMKILQYPGYTLRSIDFWYILIASSSLPYNLNNDANAINPSSPISIGSISSPLLKLSIAKSPD